MFFFSFLFFSPSYLSSSLLHAFSGALTTAFLLGTCLKGSPQHVVSSGHLLWLLFVGINKPKKPRIAFQQVQTFPFLIINCIQTLREVWATWVQKPREDHILVKRTEKWKRDEERTWSKDKMFSLVLFSASGFVPNFYSNGEVFFFTFLLILVSVLFIFSSLWTHVMRENLVIVQRSKVFCLNEWRKRKKDGPSLPPSKKPQDASWRRSPPTIAGGEGGGIKWKRREKVIFLCCLSILSVGFFYFLLRTFIKLIIISSRAPQVRRKRVFVPPALQPSPRSTGKKTSYINIWSSYCRYREKARQIFF